MKTIFKQFLNQENALEDRVFAIEIPFAWIKDSPVIFLWIVWFLYLGLDLFVRWVGVHQIAPYEIILTNFLGWGIFNQFWFMVFLPNLIFLKKWVLELTILSLLLGTYLIFKIAVIEKISGQELILFHFLINELLRSLQFLLYTTAIWGFYALALSQNSFRKLEIDLVKLQIEHKSLQLSPHFVLNMISQFLASILQISKPTYIILTRFTEILSYSYKNPQQENSLAQEIHALENYIACQRYRFGDKLKFRVIKNFSSVDPVKFMMPKWILMTFLENVFKHGDCFQSEFPCFLDIRLKSINNGGSIFIFCLTNPNSSLPKGNSTHFGINAAARILNFYFPESSMLYAEKTLLEFNLFLIIYYE